MEQPAKRVPVLILLHARVVRARFRKMMSAARVAREKLGIRMMVCGTNSEAPPTFVYLRAFIMWVSWLLLFGSRQV